jgi:hypothetical protein
MLAGLGAGIYRDADDAIARCVRLPEAIEPSPTAHAHYNERFAAWQELAAADVARRQT